MTNPPYIVTRQMLASRAVDVWREQYKAPQWKYTDKMSILVALGESPTPEQVNAVIGNSSWTRLTCNQCGNEVDTVIVVGEESHTESSTASLCIACLEQAYKLAQGQARER